MVGRSVRPSFGRLKRASLRALQHMHRFVHFVNDINNKINSLARFLHSYSDSTFVRVNAWNIIYRHPSYLWQQQKLHIILQRKRTKGTHRPNGDEESKHVSHASNPIHFFVNKTLFRFFFFFFRHHLFMIMVYSMFFVAISKFVSYFGFKSVFSEKVPLFGRNWANAFEERFVFFFGAYLCRSTINNLFCFHSCFFSSW